ncbi:hypothetical protein ASA1KI_43530 [Opitutales bacterium ASA1]|nr:hypothetical protein ASA1KI_43530 [Opitutales bacterium ASA1]
MLNESLLMSVWKLLSFGGVVVVGAIAFLSTTRVSGEKLTRGNFLALEFLIRQFERDGGKLPVSLYELGIDEADRFSLLEDAWGGRILYSHDGAHVRLSSLGSDGRTGGAGSARDLDHSFIVARRFQR